MICVEWAGDHCRLRLT